MQRKLTFVLAMLLLACSAPMLAGCYTAAGAGQDLQAAGRGIQHSADRNTTYSP
jgi:predicted small secreted protein